MTSRLNPRLRISSIPTFHACGVSFRFDHQAFSASNSSIASGLRLVVALHARGITVLVNHTVLRGLAL